MIEKQLTLDSVDEAIVWGMAMDGRVSIAALAARVGIAASTCHARVTALIKNGVLRSFHAKIDLDALGLPFQALVMVRMRPQDRDELFAYARRLIRLPQVENVFHVSSAENFVVHVACASRRQLRDFVSTAIHSDPRVVSTQTNLIFDHLIGYEHMAHLDGFDEVRRDLA